MMSNRNQMPPTGKNTLTISTTIKLRWQNYLPDALPFNAWIVIKDSNQHGAWTLSIRYYFTFFSPL